MKGGGILKLSGGGWKCHIYADNREAAWGEHGLKRIKKTDRVHFAAKVIGIVERLDSAEANERTVVPVVEG